MRRFSRDPEAIVQRLLQSERHRSAGAQDEVLALGPVAVPGISAESRLDDRFADLRPHGDLGHISPGGHATLPPTPVAGTRAPGRGTALEVPWR